MDTYLALAERVLRQVRQPLSARQILRVAYATGMAPAHLHGRTQHKTLQARLSENILQAREQSTFYRTAPGRFLLRELMSDPSLPRRFRTEVVARRRLRDLMPHRALTLSRTDLSAMSVGAPEKVTKLIQTGSFHYSSPVNRTADDVVVWSFAVVVRGSQLLTYRRGRYRENRDTFYMKRTVGFYSIVSDQDLTLFDRMDHGIVSKGVQTVASDLDIALPGSPDLTKHAAFASFVLPEGANRSNELLGIVRVPYPQQLEPSSRRLSIHDVRWIDLDVPLNHIEDFDPWSIAVLTDARRTLGISLPRSEWRKVVGGGGVARSLVRRSSFSS